MKRYFFMLAAALLTMAATAQTTYYQKVETTPADWSGEYLIVREVDSLSSAWVFNGALTVLDAKNNCFSVSVDKTNDRIASTSTVDAATFTIAKRTDGSYSIKSKSGYYIGYNSLDTANLANLKYDKTDKYVNYITMESDTTTKVKILAKSGYVLRFNAETESNRFRFYTEGKKKAIHLYKKVDATAIDATAAAEDQKKVDGSLYFLPKGVYIQNGRLIYVSE